MNKTIKTLKTMNIKDVQLMTFGDLRKSLDISRDEFIETFGMTLKQYNSRSKKVIGEDDKFILPLFSDDNENITEEVSSVKEMNSEEKLILLNNEMEKYCLDDLEKREFVKELEDGIEFDKVLFHLVKRSHDNINERLDAIEDVLRENGLMY